MKGVFTLMWLVLQGGSLYADEAGVVPAAPASTEAQPATPGPTEAPPAAPATSTESAPASSFGFSVGATYYAPFNDRSDPLANIELSLTSPLGDGETLTLSQGFTKYFYLEGEQFEYEPQDTVVSVASKITDADMPFQASLSIGLTVPTSKFSQAQRVHSKPKIGLRLSDKIWNDSLAWSFSAFYRYYINEFKTTRFETDAGGDPLPWMQYGGTLGLTKALTPSWDLSLGFSYGEIQYERNTGFEEFVEEDPVADHPYSVDLSVGRALTEHLGLSFGYSNGSQVEAFGGMDFVLFDDALAVWYVSLTYSR